MIGVCVAAVVVASEVPVGGLSMCLPPCWVGFLSNCLPAGSFTVVWLERGESTMNPNQECPPRFPSPRKASAMTITIGIDPHKGSHTAVAIDSNEIVLDEI